MKILVTLTLIILSFQIAYSQQTTLVIKDKSEYYEEYSVLKSDKKIKHGSYVKLNKRLVGGYAIISTGSYQNGQKDGIWETYYGETNNIKEKGFYKNDVRDSLWVMFYPQGIFKNIVEVQGDGGAFLQVEDTNPVICKIGTYKKDKPIGIWEYYDERGELSQKYNYDSLILTDKGGQSIKNCEAGFIGGDFLLNQHVYSTFDFDGLMNTINSKIDLETGKIIFKFTIDEHGLIEDINCTEQTIKNKKIYARAFETLQSLDGQFYPKKINGNNQRAEKVITFDLDAKSKHSFYTSERFNSTTLSLDFQMKIVVE